MVKRIMGILIVIMLFSSLLTVLVGAGFHLYETSETTSEILVGLGVVAFLITLLFGLILGLIVICEDERL